ECGVTMNRFSYQAIVTVGEGRGFVVANGDDCLVVTAAHCLPSLPPCATFSHVEERTYRLLGPIDGTPTVWAECLFADPVGDIAVLGAPDNQALSTQYEDYEALMNASVPLSVIDAAEDAPGWLLSLDRRWFQCTVRHYGGELWVSNAEQDIVGGMSGSPIVTADGLAIGVVCTSQGPNARLCYHLPTRFVHGCSISRTHQ